MNKDGMQSICDTSAGLARLGELVAARMGLHFPEGRRRDLVRGAQALAREHGCEDGEAFLQSLINSPLSDRQMEILTAHLTVGETYFFREMKSLDAFQNHVIPELLRQRSGGDQRIRIWCAGCSTGEEAYTIAIILSELIPDLTAWDVDILATDINPAVLEKARQGVYTEWSFRGMPESKRKKYFEPHGSKKFAIRTRFKDMVSFACINLASDTYPSLQNNTNALDVIFCRNVLMYFVPELVHKVITRFQHCLLEGGWFIVAPSECSILSTSEFASVPFDGATLYRKNSHKPPVSTISTQIQHSNAEMNIERSTFNFKLRMKNMERRKLGGKEFSMTEERQQSTGNGIESSEPRVSHSESSVPSSKSSVPTADPYEEALSAYRKGCYDDAAASLQILFDAESTGESKAGDALALMARINANQGKLDQAVKWAERAIVADKVNPSSYYLLATVLEEQHRPADAVQALKRALYLDSKFILAHFSLGNIALQQNRPKDADRHFMNAASLLEDMPEDAVLPESEGLTSGRLLEIIENMMAQRIMRKKEIGAQSVRDIKDEVGSKDCNLF
jgi:chemotaxis protein methyltransferase CheR